MTVDRSADRSLDLSRRCHRKTAGQIGVGLEALPELRLAAEASGVEQQTLDAALQRFTRRAARAAQGTSEVQAARGGRFASVRYQRNVGDIEPSLRATSGSEAIQKNWIATPPSGARDDGEAVAHALMMPIG